MMNYNKHQATESLSLDQARSRLIETSKHVSTLIKRLEPILPSGPINILEIGAAQGRGIIALARLGHYAYGVEPWKPAIDIANRLADDCGVRITLVETSAEKIPFEECKFDLVLAFSVMEHVTDLQASLNEIVQSFPSTKDIVRASTIKIIYIQSNNILNGAI
jgi:SAM-dependent methyltransferase